MITNHFVFRMTCNQVRHLTVSLMNAVMPEESTDLAKYMCHSTHMQQHTYDNLIKSDKMIRISNIVRKILSNEMLQEDDLKEPSVGE